MPYPLTGSGIKRPKRWLRNWDDIPSATSSLTDLVAAYHQADAITFAVPEAEK